MSAPAAPPPEVLDAFVARGPTPVLLPGGRGLTWRVGDLVVKPADDPAESGWRSGVLNDLEHTAAFRTPRPVSTLAGDWVEQGWEAWEWMPGAADENRLTDVIRAGAAFHAALAGEPRPSVLERRDDPWCRADQLVWEGVPSAPIDVLDRLVAAFVPVSSPSQLIHGDLLGNVLFAPGRPPTIIDWAPYWRPAGLAAAIAVVDAVCWHGHPTNRLAALGHGIPEWRQLSIRALAFRIATLHLLGAWDRDLAHRHTPVATAILDLPAGDDPDR